MKSNCEVLILAGGKGTRLAEIVRDVPKPMAPISGKPFLEFLIKSVKDQGFFNITLLVGYKSEIIESHFGNGSSFGVNIKYSYEQSPLGTGGCIKQAISDSSSSHFLVLNGDTLFEADLDLFLSEAGNDFAIALKYSQDSGRFGQVKIDDNYKVENFLEKQLTGHDGLINAGIYSFSKDILNYFPVEDSFSIEQVVFPSLSSKRKLKGIPLGGKFIDIGIPADYEKAQNFLQEFKFSQRTPALFLDRDGIIIKDTGYVSSISQVEFYPGIIPIIKLVQKMGYPVYMITNQAGVGRNYFSLEVCDSINQHIVDHLKTQGAFLTKCFVSPFHPSHGVGEYKRDSLLRKPNPGMILLAQEHMSIDIRKSLMIGDKTTDIIKLPGLKSILLQGDYDLGQSNMVFSDFKSLCSFVEAHFQQESA